MLHKLLTTTALSLILSACGGGGGETPKPATSSAGTSNPTSGGAATTLSISSDIRTLSVDESTEHTVTINVSYTGDKTLTYTTSSSSNAITASATGGDLLIAISDITNYQSQGSVDIKVSDGDVEDTHSVDISIKNTSLLDDIETSTALTRSLVSHYEQDISVQNVLSYYLEISALLGEVSPAEAKSELELLSGRVYDEQLASKRVIRDIGNAISSASNAQTVSEADIQSWLADIHRANTDFAQISKQSISQARSATADTVPEMAIESLNTNGEISLFIGNTSLGQFDGDTFVFSPTFAYLEALVTNNPAVCTTLISADA